MISRSHVKPQVLLTINGTPVTTVESVNYLGVTIASDLRWNTHISNICKSSKCKLGLIYCNFHQANQQTLCQLCKALVLPKLDYCSRVWDPTYSTVSDKLECVQRFAAKLCTKCWSDSLTVLMSELNWPSFHSRCSRQKALLCRWIIKMSQSSPYHHIFILPLTSTLECITLILSVSPLPVLFHFKHSFLYLLAICGTAFLNMWSTCHPHVHLRLHLCGFHHLS